MNPTIVSALAALLGALVGGTTSVLASWIAQRGQAVSKSRDRLLGQREKLYREFIENSVECYANALQHDEVDAALVVRLYGTIDLMRLHSSQPVIDAAQQVRARIMNTYRDPNKDPAAIAKLVLSDSIDLLGTFSSVCREELASLRDL